MLRSSFPEARRLTDLLRDAATPSQRFARFGNVEEHESTLQMVLEGGVLRQRFLPDGSGQTVAVYYRNDVINLTGYVGSPARNADYLMALEGTIVGEVPDSTLQSMRADAPEGMAVLVLHELRIAHERISCLGQRSALERTAHFLCETLIRNLATTAGTNLRCCINLTQEMLSSVLGMTSVHMNRTLRELRQRNLADVMRGVVIVPDFAALAAAANFDDGYLIRF